jgi:hypothetical protein
MSVASLCAVCESREAERTCDRCGRGVCAQHYDDAFGLCLDCGDSAGSGGPGGPSDPDGTGRDDVGDTVQF